MSSRTRRLFPSIVLILSIAFGSSTGLSGSVSAQTPSESSAEEATVARVWDATLESDCEMTIQFGDGPVVPVECPAGSVVYIDRMTLKSARAQGIDDFVLLTGNPEVDNARIEAASPPAPARVNLPSTSIARFASSAVLAPSASSQSGCVQGDGTRAGSFMHAWRTTILSSRFPTNISMLHLFW